MKIIDDKHLPVYLGTNPCEYFLTMENISLEILKEEMESDKVISNFTLLSIPSVLKWIFNRIELLHKANSNMSDNEYHSHINGEIDNLILHASYYLGASFVNSIQLLSWETKNKNQTFPVVEGFKYDFKMRPVDEVNDIYYNHILSKNSTPIDLAIDEVVLRWLFRLENKTPNPQVTGIAPSHRGKKG